ncbi:hypothetical protein [Altererythrobacter sp. Z27]|uniref:hypothetical protein n=1 Tax=Altererythrobacter sp. Z27 TaxID=3461147 RepID=UPI00404397FD
MTDGRDNHARHVVRGVFLLFSRNERPDRAAIRDFVKAHPAISLTHDPSSQAQLHLVGEAEVTHATPSNDDRGGHGELVWLELLREGLTFDIAGLLPGTGFEIPPCDHQFDYREEICRSRLEAVRLTPGSHLAGGEASLPVLRSMFSLTRELVRHFEAIEAIAWPPSSSLIGRRFFESTIAAWLEGGAFPALGLTAFRETLDGGLVSVGLEFLIGQELRIEPSLAGDKVAATRLGVRLVNQLVLSGAVERMEQIIGPDGQRLQLEPSSNGRFVRVWTG